SVAATSDGDLEMIFRSGHRLEILHHSTYEAWTLTGPRGTVVYPPRGHPAI
ncbi:MAG: DUF6188 family protein, partial [Acidimicrobiales bacterium]